MTELTMLATKLGGLLKERKETIAVAESSAGGLISAALLAVPGASAYFLGGAVVYTQVARRGLLRVPDEREPDRPGRQTLGVSCLVDRLNSF